MQFKDFLSLFERIYSDSKGKVTIAAQIDRGASDKQEISTYLPAHGVPHSTTGRMTNDIPVYSTFNAVSSGASGETTLLLKALKGLGPYTANERQISWLLATTARWLKTFLEKEKIDIILYPRSSSDFLHKFIAELKREYPNIKVLDNSFVKRTVKSIDDELDSFIDKDHPDYKKLGAKSQEELRKNIKRIIQKNVSAGKEATLDAKKLYKGHAKFVKNFMKFVTEDEYEIMEKRVLIVDDILTSGSTFVDMAKQLKPYAPRSVRGFTLFKVISATR